MNQGHIFEHYDPPAHLIPTDPRFGCGPSLIPLEFVEKLLKTGPHLLGTGHRQSPVKNLIREIQVGMSDYFQLSQDQTIIIGTGGATLLFDMIALGAVHKKAVHFICGEFSKKWFDSASRVPWIETKHVSVPYGQGVIPAPMDGFDTLCTTLNETSTGVQLPHIPSVDEETLLVVDATSGAGQIQVDVNKVDIFFFSPQKIFASEGSMFVAIVSPKAKERIESIAKNKDRYIPGIMNWIDAIKYASKGQTSTTPSISTLFFLKQQLDLLNKKGYEAVCKEARVRADLIYQWAMEKPYLNPYVKEPRFRSHAVATIDVNESIDVKSLSSLLEKKKIVYGIEPYRKLNRNQLRICFFYNVARSDLDRLLQLLSHAMESVWKN